jgi:aspartate kinase
MALIVQKFGGTSVGTPERIQKVADRIAASRKHGDQLIVVVSAMGHTTDELIELAHQVSKTPFPREMDMLLTAGERISTALLSMALHDRKVPAISLTGSQTGIITDAGHRRARIKRILGDRVRAGLAEKKVVIVAGFQGVSEDKEITTLGRGGSDTTAVALAAALKADRCEIYTDVDGVYSADPRVIREQAEARLWSRLPANLMLEMAVRGAGVLHPRSVELAEQYGVALVVKNSLNEKEGTRIFRSQDMAQEVANPMEEFGITGVTSDSSKMLVTITLARPTALAAIWERAAEFHLPVVTPMFSDGSVRFFSDRDGEGEWTKLLERLSTDGFVKEYRVHPELVPLSVVGHRFSQDGLALQRLIEILAQHHITVTTGAASALAATVAVSRDHAEDGVRALHREFLKPRNAS